MAVRHGYGKVAGTDALVFAYDTGDTRNSYKGEPTTNYTTDTPSQGGWSGTYEVLDSSRKTFRLNVSNFHTDNRGWRSFTWDLTAYSGQSVTISATVEVPSSSPGTFAWIMIGQTNTYTNNRGAGQYLGYSAGSERYQKTTTTTERITWSGVLGSMSGANQPSGHVGFTLWYNDGTPGTNSYVEISDVQIETKSHATPFTAGTRSATQGLKDLTGNTSIDLTNAGFDSNAQLDFDGTNTYIPKFTDSIFQFADTDLTYEVVVNFNSNPDSYQTLIGLADTNDYIPRINLSKFRSGTGTNGKVGNVYMQLIDQNGSGTAAADPVLSGTDLVAGGYYHYVGVISKPAGSSTYYVYLYRNGELVTTTNSGRTTYDTTQGVQGSIGLAVGTQFGNTASVLDGQLPVAKVYNRALTAAEVQNNYRNYKGRFNI